MDATDASEPLPGDVGGLSAADVSGHTRHRNTWPVDRASTVVDLPRCPYCGSRRESVKLRLMPPPFDVASSGQDLAGIRLEPGRPRHIVGDNVHTSQQSDIQRWLARKSVPSWWSSQCLLALAGRVLSCMRWLQAV
jgi:hypothetical protein